MTTGSSFAQLPAIAQEVYRNADGKVRVLRYRTMAGHRSGQIRHLVIIDYPALERGSELLRSCSTVEEARQVWREGRIRMACSGYDRVNFRKKGP